MEKVLLVGSGYVGLKILSAISSEMDVTVVDKNINSIKEIVETDNVHPIYGNVEDRNFVMNLFKESYDFVVAVTNSDKTNILLSTMAKKNGTKCTIASIFQKDSVEQLTFLKQSIGLDRMYNMAIEMSAEVERIIKGNLSYQSDVFGKGRIEVVGHSVEMDRNFVGQKIKDIGELKTLLVVGISRRGDIIIPNGDTVIYEDDYLYIMGLSKDILNFKHKHFRIEYKPNRKILLVGVNEFSLQIAEVFKDYDITIVEENIEKIRKYRTAYSNVYIHKAKLRGGEFFKNFKNYDATIITTENDELNLILGTIANRNKINQVMVKLSDTSYESIVDEMNFTSVLKPMDVVANQIIKKLRSDRGISIYMAFNNQAEVYEFKLKDDSALIGKTLMEMNVPTGMLVGGIIRKDGMAVIPRGKTIVEKGDNLVIFCKNDSKDKLNRFLGVESRRSFIQSIF
ncbi:TrkA C-terminal domain-containing protein [Peptoniphilus asaccharolyticus]